MTSSLYLTDPTLGQIDIGPDDATPPGSDPYVVHNLIIGGPETREVMSNRALADGAIDYTEFFSSSVISFSVAINRAACVSGVDPQARIDALKRWMRPNLRPRLFVRIPESDVFRSAIVRGVPPQVGFGGTRIPILPCQFVVANGVMEEATERTMVVNPSIDTEEGRNYDGTPTTYGPHYDTAGNRVYPPTEALGSRKITVNASAPTNWRATIFGGCVNPNLFVNDRVIQFNQAGGITLGVGDTIEIDTVARTILLNGSTPILDKVNLTQWQWADLRFQPGENLVRFDAANRSPEASCLFRWRGAFL